MPRYYFHLTDGKQVLNNHKGIDLSGQCRRPLAPAYCTPVVSPKKETRTLEIAMYCANFPSNVMADTARNRQSGSVADSRRALTVLGDNPDGCTQAILLAHGFKSQLLAELVRTKLVTEHYERVMQGGRPINVTRMRITAAGRLALKPLR